MRENLRDNTYGPEFGDKNWQRPARAKRGQKDTVVTKRQIHKCKRHYIVK